MGHVDHHCALFELNAQQEATNNDRITAERLFPGNPGLIELLKEVQRKWKISERIECRL